MRAGNATDAKATPGLQAAMACLSDSLVVAIRSRDAGSQLPTGY